MNIPDEFKMTRQGKTMVLYAGLLNEAHNRLSEIDTELQQVPSNENGQVAIVKAWVKLRNPEDGTERVFGGIGDASPENVNRNIAPHIIRMAETRAKARALRDALNVHAEILEDAPESPDPTRTTNQPRSGAQTTNTGDQRPGPGAQVPIEGTVKANSFGTARTMRTTAQNKATRKQLNYLEALINEHLGSIGEWEQATGLVLTEISPQDASDQIKKLQAVSG